MYLYFDTIQSNKFGVKSNKKLQWNDRKFRLIFFSNVLSIYACVILYIGRKSKAELSLLERQNKSADSADSANSSFHSQGGVEGGGGGEAGGGGDQTWEDEYDEEVSTGGERKKRGRPSIAMMKKAEGSYFYRISKLKKKH